jgi:hypothetical protein
LKRSYAILAIGSAFWHGSHTYVGNSFDNNMMGVLAYLSHEAMVSNLPGDSTILKQLSETPRSKTAVETTTELTEMFSTQPVAMWAEMLDEADIPHDYNITFSAFVVTILSMIVPFFLVEAFM